MGEDEAESKAPDTKPEGPKKEKGQKKGPKKEKGQKKESKQEKKSKKSKTAVKPEQTVDEIADAWAAGYAAKEATKE